MFTKDFLTKSLNMFDDLVDDFVRKSLVNPKIPKPAAVSKTQGNSRGLRRDLAGALSRGTAGAPARINTLFESQNNAGKQMNCARNSGPKSQKESR